MAGPSKLSRRLSEFLGVALFAAALIWLIALVTYDPSDPAWFFNTGSNAQPVNFIGRVGAFLAELSFQLFGYASYLVPVILVLVGWHLFWCTRIDAIYTKLVGALCLFGSACALLALVIGRAGAAGRPLAGGGFFGERLAAWLGDSLNRPGSLIVLVTVLMLSVILLTQFSFGRFFAEQNCVRRMTETWPSRSTVTQPRGEQARNRPPASGRPAARAPKMPSAAGAATGTRRRPT